jgi:hypothetical protein
MVMLNITLADVIVGACAVFAVSGVVGFIYESWRPPTTVIKNIEISAELE